MHIPGTAFSQPLAAFQPSRQPVVPPSLYHRFPRPLFSANLLPRVLYLAGAYWNIIRGGLISDGLRLSLSLNSVSSGLLTDTSAVFSSNELRELASALLRLHRAPGCKPTWNVAAATAAAAAARRLHMHTPLHSTGFPTDCPSGIYTHRRAANASYTYVSRQNFIRAPQARYSARGYLFPNKRWICVEDGIARASAYRLHGIMTTGNNACFISKIERFIIKKRLKISFISNSATKPFILYMQNQMCVNRSKTIYFIYM